MSELRAAVWQVRPGGSAVSRGAALLLPALLVAISGWVMSLRGHEQAYAAAVSRGENALQQLAAGDREMAGLEAQRGALAAARASLQELHWRLDGGEGLRGLVEQLTLAGQAHGLQFERIEMMAEQPAGAGYRRQSLQLQVQGGYPALRAWLGQSVQQLRVLEVSQLSVRRISAGKQLIQAQMRIHAYQADAQLPAPVSLADEPARARLARSSFDPFTPPASGAGLPLEHIPLEQLAMVGSLARAGRYQALVRGAGRLFRVSPGQRLGHAQAVVAHIDARHMVVREPVYLAGTWQEQVRYLALGNEAPGESMDEQVETGGVRSAAGVLHERQAGPGGSRG